MTSTTRKRLFYIGGLGILAAAVAIVALLVRSFVNVILLGE